MSSRALAQRRQLQREDVQAVVQVLAELSLATAFAQIAIGGGDDADVDLDRALPPTRSNSRSWSTRSSFTCTSSGISPISSRKIVPPSASSKRPMRRSNRAGERALLVAEQLALDQAGRQGGAVDLDERLVAPRAGRVDGAGDQLLAGAGLAGDQHRGVGRRDADRPFRARRAAPGCAPTISSKLWTDLISSCR